MRVISGATLKKLEKANTAFSKYVSKETIGNINAETDELLMVVKFHLVFENLLQTWVEMQTGCPDIFKGLDTLGFHIKLYMAKNLGLNKNIFLALSLINGYRNKFAHQLDKSISDTDIKSLLDAVENIINPADPTSNSVYTLQMQVGKNYLSYKELKNNTQKFYLLLVALLAKTRTEFFDIEKLES